MKCSVGAAYFAQTADSKGSKAVTLPPAVAAAASFFVPVVAAQIRNDQLVKALQSAGSLDLDSASIADLASYLEAKLPKSIAYKCQQLHPLQISRFQHRNC